MRRGLVTVGLVYGAVLLAVYAFSWRGAVTFIIGVSVGLLIGRRSGRRDATFDAARSLNRDRPRDVFDYLDAPGTAVRFEGKPTRFVNPRFDYLDAPGGRF